MANVYEVKWKGNEKPAIDKRVFIQFRCTIWRRKFVTSRSKLHNFHFLQTAEADEYNYVSLAWLKITHYHSYQICHEKLWGDCKIRI